MLGRKRMAAWLAKSFEGSNRCSLGKMGEALAYRDLRIRMVDRIFMDAHFHRSPHRNHRHHRNHPAASGCFLPNRSRILSLPREPRFHLVVYLLYVIRMHFYRLIPHRRGRGDCCLRARVELVQAAAAESLPQNRQGACAGALRGCRRSPDGLVGFALHADVLLHGRNP